MMDLMQTNTQPKNKLCSIVKEAQLYGKKHKQKL